MATETRARIGTSRPAWIVAIEIASIVAFVLLWGLVFAGVLRATPAARLLWLVPVTGVAGFAAADFVGGCVHWLADTYFDPRTPVLGPLLVSPFRAHHRDPEDIVRHGFLELLGNNALATLPLAAMLLLPGGPGASLVAQALHLGVAALAVALFATNAFHRWAHMGPAPPAVAWLQRRGMVLSPEMHGRHHRDAHDRSYCVTSGWLNPVLDRVAFFARLEAGIERLRPRVTRRPRAGGR